MSEMPAGFTGHAVGPAELDPATKVLSRAECVALAGKVARFAVGGGRTGVLVRTSWTGSLRWARNRILTGGDVRSTALEISRTVHGASAVVTTTQTELPALEAAVRRAERLLIQRYENSEWSLPAVSTPEPFPEPQLWFDASARLQGDQRAQAIQSVIQRARQAGMMAAGYLQVAAYGVSLSGDETESFYYPYTTAQYSVTVRDPQGTASGWAGVDWNDWGRIDPGALAAIALQKCLDSQNAVAAEPGRYLTILEPQAVCDFVAPLFGSKTYMDRAIAEAHRRQGPFEGKNRDTTKIGEIVIDERITVEANPVHPDLGFMPFAATALGLEVYHPSTWIKDGVLSDLAYSREYAQYVLLKNSGLPTSGAFRMTGGTSTIANMIATTTRGILVTRMSDVAIVDDVATVATGYTRDGVWLIENGKISKPLRNFRFTQSILAALNNVVDLGPPVRAFHPEAPVVVPALKITDFNFSSLSGAV